MENDQERPVQTFNVIFRLVREPRTFSIRCKADSAASLGNTVCGWILAGSVPIEMPDGTVWQLPDAAIEGFEVEEKSQ